MSYNAVLAKKFLSHNIIEIPLSALLFKCRDLENQIGSYDLSSVFPYSGELSRRS